MPFVGGQHAVSWLREADTPTTAQAVGVLTEAHDRFVRSQDQSDPRSPPPKKRVLHLLSEGPTYHGGAFQGPALSTRRLPRESKKESPRIAKIANLPTKSSNAYKTVCQIGIHPIHGTKGLETNLNA